eukprot:gene572-616_t
MYSTKLVNKSMVAGNAYITVGDPYADPKANPFRAGKKGEKLTPFQVKMVPQNAEDGHFAKKTYVPEGYKESIKYITTQPLDNRKRGFGSKDASRRDEFSNNIRTEQYRETLIKEKLLAESPEEIKEKLTKLLSERAAADSDLAASMTGSTRRTLRESGRRSLSASSSGRIHQYDIGRSQVTPFDPKSSRDTYYKFDSDYDKFVGGLTKPVSYDIGQSAWDTNYKPPSFGGRSEVKNFFDKSHLHIPPY